MDNKQKGTKVEVLFKFKNIEYAEKVVIAVNSYFTLNHSDYIFDEIRDGGIYSDELTVVFISHEQDHKELAESVHRFLSSFIDEFYDNTLEEDWLNEMDCDEMPVIVSYEVNVAKEYIEKKESDYFTDY